MSADAKALIQAELDTLDLSRTEPPTVELILRIRDIEAEYHDDFPGLSRWLERVASTTSDPKTIETLVGLEDVLIAGYMTENPATPLEALVGWTKEFAPTDPDMAYRLATTGRLEAKHVDKLFLILIEDGDEDVLEEIYEYTSPELQKVYDEYGEIREGFSTSDYSSHD